MKRDSAGSAAFTFRHRPISIIETRALFSPCFIAQEFGQKERQAATSDTKRQPTKQSHVIEVATKKPLGVSPRQLARIKPPQGHR